MQVIPGTGSAQEFPELRAAAEAVAAGLEEVDVAVSVTDIRGALVALLKDLDSDYPPCESGPDPALRRRLVDLLRGHLLAEWTASTTPPDVDRVLALLGRLETAALRLDAMIPGATTIGYPTALEFVAGVAHDLRSPLTSILFLSETLRAGQSGPVTDAQRQQLGIMYAAALGLVSVASDIIELVRGGDGLTERTPSVFSLTEMLESVRDIVRPMAEERGLALRLIAPAADHRLGHPLALSRVLLNLTTNGLKNTAEGFVEVSVCETEERQLEFSVRDSGPGISPDALQNLYKPFQTSRDGRRKGFSGTGLGLAISRRLVAAMGANLHVEVSPGAGTRFFFVLDLPVPPQQGN